GYFTAIWPVRRVPRSGPAARSAFWRSEVAPRMTLPTSKLERPNTVDLHLGGRSVALRTPLVLKTRGAIAVIANPPWRRLANSANVFHRSPTSRTVHAFLPRREPVAFSA